MLWRAFKPSEVFAFAITGSFESGEAKRCTLVASVGGEIAGVDWVWIVEGVMVGEEG